MSDWKMELYDIISIIFVGVAVIIAAALLFPGIRELIEQGSNIVNGVLLIITSYALGRGIQGLSQAFVQYTPYDTGKIKKIAWTKSLSDQVRKEIEKALKEFYGFDEIPEKNIENLCLSPVHDRMSKRDIFVAIADYNRSMSFLSLVGAITAGARIYYSSEKHLMLLLLFSLLVFSLVFYKGYIIYTKHGAVVVYYSFLSWWKEKKVRV